MSKITINNKDTKVTIGSPEFASITLENISGVERFRNWVGEALKQHYETKQEVPSNIDLKIIFDFVKKNIDEEIIKKGFKTKPWVKKLLKLKNEINSLKE